MGLYEWLGMPDTDICFQATSSYDIDSTSEEEWFEALEMGAFAEEYYLKAARARRNLANLIVPH